MHDRPLHLLQVTISSDDDTTYWCYGTQLPQEVRDQQRYITRVRNLLHKHLEHETLSMFLMFNTSISHSSPQGSQATVSTLCTTCLSTSVRWTQLTLELREFVLLVLSGKVLINALQVSSLLHGLWGEW